MGVKHQPRIIIATIFILMCLGLFLYRYNLEHSYVFKGDTARDMRTVLQLYRSKKVTLIGPPISFGQSTIREVYFGSLHYYLGMLGLALNGFAVTSATLVNTAFMLGAIPAFFLLSACCLKKNWQRLLATILFTVGPVTVLYTRLYWNPSPIIPLSIFFWLCVYYSYIKKSASKWIFFAGCIAGIVFNLHYFAALPLLIIPFLRIRSWKRIGIWFIAGFTLASLPLLFFEIRHSWFLTQGMLYQLQNGTGLGHVSLLERLQRADFGLLVPFGIYEGEYYYGTLVALPRFFTVIISMGIAAAVIYWLKSNKVKGNTTSFITGTVWTVGLALSATALASGILEYFMRYLFAVYPMLLLLVSAAFIRYRLTFFAYLCGCIYAIMTSLHIIMLPADSPHGYISLATLEKASRFIQQDNNHESYNVTENTIGDARATSLRYFLERDAQYKPALETQYEHLTILYVLTKNLSKAEQEQRWEFTATPGLKKIRKIELDKSIWLVVYRK